MSSEILSAEKVVLTYDGMNRPALQSVSLSIEKGISLGIVGESGSGKSSLARCFLGLEKLTSGCVNYRGQDLRSFRPAEWKDFRRNVQMVFQDPYNSLNPRMTIGQTLAEVLHVHQLAAKDENTKAVQSILNQVGLSTEMAGRYPHELSGGQRQRVGIARALALKPSVIIADEPVSALDVSVQAQILNLLKQLITEANITLVLIAHDLAVVRYICPKIAVMKQGVVVEQGETEQIINSPRDAYTQTLLAAVPDIDRLLTTGHL